MVPPANDYHQMPDHGHSHGGQSCHGHGGDHNHGHSHVEQPQHGHSHGDQPCHGHGHGDHGHSHDHGDSFDQDDFESHHVQIIPNKFLDKTKFNVDSEFERDGLRYVEYKDERQMPLIMNLITKDLSEPYSIYTYRYFIHNWPFLCFLAMDKEECVGAIVCKLDRYKEANRGYIAMLDVDDKYRRRKIGSNLVESAIKRMIQHNADEVVLETEVTNKGALRLYENLGFVRDKRLFRYYLNGVEAFRLKLWLK